jgi:hypothetical protein
VEVGTEAGAGVGVAPDDEDEPDDEEDEASEEDEDFEEEDCPAFGSKMVVVAPMPESCSPGELPGIFMGTAVTSVALFVADDERDGPFALTELSAATSLSSEDSTSPDTMTAP